MINCDRHPGRFRENLQILSTKIELMKNTYANVLKAPSSHALHIRFFGLYYLRKMPLNRSI